MSTGDENTARNATGTLADILVIDDNADFLETMQQIIETADYSVRTALDGKEGLEQIKKKIPDILFVDLIMPKISGEQLIEYVRSEAELKDIPIVVVSGALREYSDHNRIGADFYIEKGVDLDKKVLALCEHIRQLGRTALESPPTPDRELTQRKIVAELLDDRRKTRQILANLRDGLILYDYDHKVFEVNKKAAVLLHKPKHELLGSPLTQIFPDPYGDDIAAQLKRTLQDKEAQDHLLLQIDDKTLDLQMSPFKDNETGQTAGGMVLLYDLTHEHKAKEKLEKKLLELDLLNKVARLLNSSLSEEVVFRAMLERAVNLLGAEAGAIALLDEKSVGSQDFVLQYAFGEAADQVQGIRLDVTQGLIGWVISSSQPLLVNNVSEDERFFRFIDHQSGFQTRSAVCVPIKSNKKIIGVIEILNKRKGAFSSSDLSLLSTIVEVAALSIKNSRLHRDILIQRDYYSNMIEALDEGIIVISRDATILDVNRFFLTFFGRSRNEVIGQKFQHYFSQIEFSYLQQIFENNEESAPGQRFMKTWSCRDSEGEMRHFNVSGIPIRLKGHADNLALMTFHDVTRLRKLNEYLESSAAVAAQLLKKEKTMEQIPEILKIMGNTSNASRCYWFNAHHDLNGRLLVSLRSEWCDEGVDTQLNNSRFQNVLFEKEYPRWAAELTEGGIISGAVAGFPDHERAEFKAQGIKSILILPLFVSGKFDGFIGFDNYRKETPWQEAEINLLRSGTDSLAKALEHEASRMEKTKLQKQLQHSQRMECMGELSSGISHNFRNILTGIISNTQHFQIKYEDNPELKAFSADILNLARMGSDLIGSLMQFSRQDTEDDKKILNLADVLNDAYQLISTSFDKKVDIQCKWPDLLPIEGNYSELHQVIMNLCNNAKDAMPSGGILQIEAKGENNRISATISDTGIGMDESTVKRVFDPFFTTKAPEDGTGLGLYTSYAIIQNHGGTVYVQSQAGLGTSFKMTFPMPQKVSKSQQPAPKRIVFGEGQKVLIVDDDRSVRKPTQSLLTSIGYDTSTAESGRKALEVYKELNPDVVLMDINMPGMDGLTTIKHLKEVDPQAKVVIVSGYEERGTHGIDDETRAMIKAYITKPFDTSELSQLLAALTKS